MLSVAAPPSLLASFKGDPNASVFEFFGAYADDLPPSHAAIARKICSGFFDIHARSRFASLFLLTTTQADTVIADAGGGAGVRKTIEEVAGFQFRAPEAPDSAALVSLIHAKTPVEQKPPRTLSVALARSGELSSSCILAPDAFADVIATADPLHNTITEPELEAATDTLLRIITEEHGTWKIGKPLAVIYGRQAHTQLPHLPDYGSKKGYQREFWKMMQDKIKNRKNVRCAPAATHATPSKPAHARFHALQKTYTNALVIRPSLIKEESRKTFDGELKSIVRLDDMFSPAAKPDFLETKPPLVQDMVLEQLTGNLPDDEAGAIFFSEPQAQTRVALTNLTHKQQPAQPVAAANDPTPASVKPPPSKRPRKRAPPKAKGATADQPAKKPRAPAKPRVPKPPAQTTPPAVPKSGAAVAKARAAKAPVSYTGMEDSEEDSGANSDGEESDVPAPTEEHAPAEEPTFEAAALFQGRKRWLCVPSNPKRGPSVGPSVEESDELAPTEEHAPAEEPAASGEPAPIEVAESTVAEKVAAILQPRKPPEQDSIPCRLGPALIRRSDDDTETPLRVEPTPQSEIVGDIYIQNEEIVQVLGCIQSCGTKYAHVSVEGDLKGYVRMALIYPISRRRK